MSSSSSALSAREAARSAALSSSQVKNPSYPQRTHFGERKELQEKLAACEEKLASMARKLATLGGHARRSSYERIYHQMLGARDQLAECARRMPLEAGALYEEDRERLTAAEAAVARTIQRWDSAGG